MALVDNLHARTCKLFGDRIDQERRDRSPCSNKLQFNKPDIAEIYIYIIIHILSYINIVSANSETNTGSCHAVANSWHLKLPQ